MILQFLLCWHNLCLLSTEDFKTLFRCFYFQDEVNYNNEATAIMFPLIITEILYMIAVEAGMVV